MPTTSPADAVVCGSSGEASVTGTVAHWDATRGFGKIRGRDRRDYFVHRTELLDVLELAPGRRVKFDPTDTPQGPRALAVSLFEAGVGGRQ
jgi:cold shock CspA family protein